MTPVTREAAIFFHTFFATLGIFRDKVVQFYILLDLNDVGKPVLST